MVPDQQPEGLIPETVQSIPLEQLHESAWNPRRRYTPEGMAELTQSIRENGVRVPLLVRPVEGNAYEIGAGHRRFRAAREAGRAAVPCLVRALTDVEFLELLALENLSHEDLTELEEAAGYRDLIERAGLDVKAIASKTGKNLAHVYARLKLLDAVDEAKQALTSGRITAGHAILLARLPQAKDQREALDETLNQPNWRGPMSVRELEAWIKRNMHMDLAKAPFPIVEADLLPAAGACTACGKRTSAQPETYSGAENDECLDRACYRSKLDALRKRALAEHPEAVKITTAYATKTKGVYHQGEYELVAAAAAKDAAGVKEAVFLDGSRAGQVVKVRLKPARQATRSEVDRKTAKAEDDRKIVEI